MPKTKETKDVEATNPDTLSDPKDDLILAMQEEMKKYRQDIEILKKSVDQRQLAHNSPQETREGSTVKITVYQKDLKSEIEPIREWRTIQDEVTADSQNHKIEEKQLIQIETFKDNLYKLPLLTFARCQKVVCNVLGKTEDFSSTEKKYIYKVDYNGEVLEIGETFIN